jgi:two-component system nitrate/nitrite response regulator NarL
MSARRDEKGARENMMRPILIKSGPEAAKIATLTKREHEIVSLLSEGLQNKLIASRLSISETTVRHHLTSIFNKLEVANRVELVIYAYRQGLASPIISQI